MSPIMLTAVRVLRVRFVNESNTDIIKKIAVTIPWEMFKQMLLHTTFPFQEFPIIVLVIIPA